MLSVLLAEQAEVIEPRMSDINWVLIAGVLQPFLVQLITKQNVSSGLKRVLNVILAALVGAGNAIYEDQQNGGPFDWKRAVVVAVGVWLASATAYVHLWKDTTALKAVDAATANIGLGTPLVAVSTPASGDQHPSPPNAPPTPEIETQVSDKSVAERMGQDRFRWTFTAEPIAPPPPPPGEHFPRPS